MLRLAPLALVLAAGCVLAPYSTTATHDTTSTGTTSTAATGTTSATATDPTTTTTVASTTSTAATTGDITKSSSSPWLECDLFAQNCPDGQKCMPWANDGSSSWNATKCTDITPNPGKPGDPCTAEGGGVSGVDSCEKAAMCWNVSQQTGEGTCIGFCMGSWDAPTCPIGLNCVINAEGTLILCLPGCDPIQQDCPNMDLCVPQPMGEGFVCVFDNSGDAGQQNDPCASPNACDPGLFCLDPALAAECDPMAAGCCLPVCDLDMPECTNQGAQCVPWSEPGTAPPGLENVGLCRLPP